jgi:hypothetical protein
MRCGKSPGQFKGLQVFLVVNLVNITNHPCLVLSWLHEICTPFLNCCDKNSSSKMNHVVSWQNGGSTYVSKTTVGVCLIEMKEKKDVEERLCPEVRFCLVTLLVAAFPFRQRYIQRSCSSSGQCMCMQCKIASFRRR